MTDYTTDFDRLGVQVPEVCLPAEGVDHSLWAVVACDQYSSERAYWDGVREAVGTAPSTLNLIFPECYLEDRDKAERIAAIQRAMKDYLARGYLKKMEPGFVLVERSTPFEKEPRVGLMIAVDLEKYRYGVDSKSLIRPTEGTIVERLPPRMQIRRGAPLELPHIMLLVDDARMSLIEPLYSARAELPVLYDFELMKGSGHVRGWHVSDRTLLGRVAVALDKLADPGAYAARYGNRDVLLFAVGDGNHSLATAKAVWEEIKAANADRPEFLAGHPGRYALVELVNIYDKGLPFHPIHRVLFNVDEAAFFAAVRAAGGAVRPAGDGAASGGTEAGKRAAAVFAAVDSPSGAPDGTLQGKVHTIGYLSASGAGTIVFGNPEANLAAGTIQGILDPWLKAHPFVSIDYIHGTESLVALAERPGNLGLYLPPVDKAGFFRTVIRDGVMPRKTFSMGEAPEKRFYVESRVIAPA